MHVTIYLHDSNENDHYMNVVETSLIPKCDKYPNGEYVVHTENDRHSYTMDQIQQITTVDG